MSQVEDVEFEEVEEVSVKNDDYDKLPSSAQTTSRKFAVKSIFENTETNTYLLGAALGGGYAVYKGKKGSPWRGFRFNYRIFLHWVFRQTLKRKTTNADG